MIITCQECQTQFQLDDAKVPKTGIRVRCSRCKCAFFVESPHRPDPDHASQLAREALGDDRAEVGEPSRKSTVSDEESDWQFNEDVDPNVGAEDPANDLAAARSAVDDLLGGASAGTVDPVVGTSDSSDSSDSSDTLDTPESPESGFDLGVHDHGLDIQDTDFSAESEPESEPEDDPNAVTLDRADWSGPSADLSSDSGLDLAGDLAADDADPSLAVHSDAAAENAAAESAADSAEPFGEPPEDLGSPSAWDIFEESDAPPLADSAPVGDSPGSTASQAGFESGGSRAFAAGGYVEEFDVEVSRADAWFTRLRGVLGWALVTALCAYACTIVFFPELLTPAPEPVAMRVAGFEVVHIEGHWVENAIAGPIYVVSGAFHNAGGTRPAPGSVLRVRLIDAHGATVVAESAVVGPPIPTMRLRESNPLDLRTAQERAAPAILHDPLERRRRRPFMAVLRDIPSQAVAFDLEAVTLAATVPDPVAAYELDAHAAQALAEEGMVADVSAAEVAAPAETR